MATKAVHASDVPNLDQVPENATPLSIYGNRLPTGVDVSNGGNKSSKFVVIGHRGHGMNILQSADRKMKAFKENSILSFNNAAKHPIDFIKFDVQKRSTAKLKANLIAKFLAQVNRARTYSLMICALTKNTFTSEYNLCSDTDYQICTGAVIIGVTRGSVYFLTNGGTQIYVDVRRNSLEEAKKVALEGGLDGIVSEVKGIFRNPSAVREIKESNLSLLTYGKLKNSPCPTIPHGIEMELIALILVERNHSAVAHRYEMRHSMSPS
ncbi:glycerophosphodiester phosphodiesterase GDPD1, chloroplastic-like protein [Tanacetum coccineum]